MTSNANVWQDVGGKVSAEPHWTNLKRGMDAQWPWRCRGRRTFVWRLVAMALLIGIGAVVHGAESSLPVSTDVEHTLAQFNRGCALMEQYRYSDAAKEFTAVLSRMPDWTAARFNLGLAYLNMQGVKGAEEYLNQARNAFETVLKSQPQHVPSHFCLGMLYQHQGNDAQALVHFLAARKSDPRDLHLVYKCAEALMSLQRNDEARVLLEEVVERDPGFVSAIYRLATQYIRSQQREKAMPLFQRFRELNADELTAGSYTVQKSYGAAGKYYLVLGADALPLPQNNATDMASPVFSPETKSLGIRFRPWNAAPDSKIGMAGIAAGDLDGDGDLDLCVVGVSDRGAAGLLWNDGTGQFRLQQIDVDRVVQPCLTDVDNDGDLDIQFGRAGVDVLVENNGAGQWTPSAVTGLNSDAVLTTGLLTVDIDSDGDLDLLSMHANGADIPPNARSKRSLRSIRVANNNRNGSFSELAETLGLLLTDFPVASIAPGDFDNDRDLDLILLSAGSQSPRAWINHRVGQYRLATSDETGLTVRDVMSATTGDPNKDGNTDLLVFAQAGVFLLNNQGECRFQPNQLFNAQFGRLGGTSGQLADMDNDGDLDIVIADAHREDGSRGPVLLLNDRPRDRFVPARTTGGNVLPAIDTGGDASCVVADFTGNGRCDIVLIPAHADGILIQNVTPKHHWISLDLAGTQRKDKKSRSNRLGIGARVEIKTGNVFQQFVVGASSGPVAACPNRIHAGLGEWDQVDWLRIVWPDSVLQAELELPADRHRTVEELPRKVSSCPHLFAWDGKQFRFVSDFGGMGGLGYLVAPGVYAQPDPTEYVPVGQLEPRHGAYELQVLEPLEEVVYFDEVKLIAVDHPRGTQVWPREMMAINAVPPPFEMFCFHQFIQPVAAVDQNGVDVRDRLLAQDRLCVGATELDPRFTGYAKEHFVELDFGDQLRQVADTDRLILCLYGSVEYAYSTTNFAASQAKVALHAPTISVRRDGRWIDVLREVGYPAGVNHMMTLDVTSIIRPSDRRIRVRTNMELFWDCISVGVHRPGQPLRLHEVAVGSADLHDRGYPREYSPDGRFPNILDYNNIDRSSAWKLMTGAYTRYGDVRDLLEAADDCYVIFGHGDEVTLRFPVASFGPVPKDCERTFVLKTDSYCKDMDLYTAHPDTVAPLPFHDMSAYPYRNDEAYPDNPATRAYRSSYNTRQVGQP